MHPPSSEQVFVRHSEMKEVEKVEGVCWEEVYGILYLGDLFVLGGVLLWSVCGGVLFFGGGRGRALLCWSWKRRGKYKWRKEEKVGRMKKLGKMEIVIVSRKKTFRRFEGM